MTNRSNANSYRNAGRDEQPAPAIVPMTIKQFVEEFPAISVGSIRWDISNAKANGLEKSGAIIRRGRTGRRILLDRDRYLSWIAGRL